MESVEWKMKRTFSKIIMAMFTYFECKRFFLMPVLW